MSLNRNVIKGLVLGLAGLAGFYYWWNGEVSRDAGYGIFMLSVVAILAAVQTFLKGSGIDIFGRDGTGGSGTTWYDGDSDGDGGD
jgi:hypothetical protein